MRNDVMEVLMRTYMLEIAAALFAIHTAALSESGHNRYYNRYEAIWPAMPRTGFQGNDALHLCEPGAGR